MYQHVVLGGTFDHIHKGHEALLAKAFAHGNFVTVGLTSDMYVRNFKTPNIRPHALRKKNLMFWLKKQGYLKRTTIIPINDAYGPSIESIAYDAIVVSEETENVAKEINTVRKKNVVPPLAIIVVPMVPAEDLKRISSTRIRNGEIDHEGKLVLPQKLRSILAKSIGSLIPDGIPIFSKDTCIISVGDTTTDVLLSKGVVPTLAIIDFQARRQAFDWNIEKWQELIRGREISYFSSGPGFINKQVMKAIKHWSADPKKFLFIIDGEEDLLVLPAILYAPLGSVVYYGQPNAGIIQVLVTEKIKQFAKKLLSRFE